MASRHAYEKGRSVMVLDLSPESPTRPSAVARLGASYIRGFLLPIFYIAIISFHTAKYQAFMHLLP